MATQMESSPRDQAWFEVDRVKVEPGVWRWYPHRFAGAVFSADFDEVRRLLPSPPLFPVRITKNRALVMAWGAHIPSVGFEPPYLGFGEVALIAYVSCGDEPAPPLLPMVGTRAMARFGFGGYMLMLVVTNRVAAELYKTLAGVPAMTAALRVEQRLESERFISESAEGVICDLTVKTDGRPTVDQSAADMSFFAYENGELYRIPVGGSGVSRCRYGRKSASLVLGDHPLAQRVKRLDLSGPWVAEFQPDRQFWMAGTPERVAARTVNPPPPLPTLSQEACHPLVVSPTPGVAFDFDQGVDRLGFDTEGVSSGSALSDRAR